MVIYKNKIFLGGKNSLDITKTFFNDLCVHFQLVAIFIQSLAYTHSFASLTLDLHLHFKVNHLHPEYNKIPNVLTLSFYHNSSGTPQP